jgi:DNA repair protein RecO (recombination protein O)
VPTLKDQAVCIRRHDWSETSLTVSLLTREHGVIRGVAKGAKREKGTFSGGIELLTRGEIVAIDKSDRELLTLTEWDLQEIFLAFRTSLLAHRVGLYIADVLHHALGLRDAHPPLYDAMLAALRIVGDVDAEDAARMRALLSFHMVLLMETGYDPELGVDVETGERLETLPTTLAFVPDKGGVARGLDGPDRWRVRGSTVQLMRELPVGDETEVAVVHRANRLVAAYLRYLWDREPPTMAVLFGSNRPTG